jgi:hypothetical protein
MPISISGHPLAIVETFKSKSLAVLRHYPEQPFCPDLVLAFVLGHFSWKSFVADSSIGLLMGDKDWFGVCLISYINHPYSSLDSRLFLCLAISWDFDCTPITPLVLDSFCLAILVNL